jgi:hypothetical protein
VTDQTAQQPFGLLTRISGETAAFAALAPAEQERWWRETLPAALRSIEKHGVRTQGIWRTSWSSDYHYCIAQEVRDIAAVEAAAAELGDAGFFRYLQSSRILGRRWGGEPGWDPDKFKARADSNAPYGGVLIYRIMDALHTLDRLQYQQRSFERIAILDRAVNDLIRKGGQRVGSYLTEWSSEWHLYVVYEFPDIPALEAFNAALPEHNGWFPERNLYMDYDIVWTIGRRVDPKDLARP